MKKFFLLGIMVCLAMVANAQRSMEWYSYWGSNVAGNQIEPQRMVVDNDGNIYVAATFGGDKVTAETTTLSSNSSSDNGDAVIVKFSPNKHILRTYPIAEAGNATIADMAIDQYGNLFVVGAFSNSIKVGTKMMPVDDTNMAEAAIYVLKLRNDGSAVRAWQISALAAKAGGIAIDSENNIIVTGTLDGDASFSWEGVSEGDMQNTAQMFVAKYANNGTPIWHQFRNDEGASTYGRPYVAVDAQNNIYVAGSINGSTTFNSNAISCTVSNAVLFAYNASGEEQWYHMINGDESEEAAGIVVSPVGQVIIAANHHSSKLTLDDMAETFSNGYDFDPTFAHSAFFAFDLNGEFKWFYNWGYSSKTYGEGADAICHALRCTDEGVIYAAGMQTGRYGGSRLPEGERTIPGGTNSSVETIDHAWIAHNTNGGWDSYLITLTRGGKLANVIRPGGPQYETGVDIALSPDKKSLYFLEAINVRDNVPYTCPDNIFDSWTDLYAPKNWASRKSNYTLLNVYCPENDGSSTKYGKDYKGVFSSSLLVKYAMPEINPNVLPYFTANTAYSQALTLANPQGKATLFPLEKSGDVEFDGETISGTFDSDADRFCGILAIDSIALPGDITYYEYDPAPHKSFRSNPRNLRYMPLTIEKTAPVTPEDPDQPAEPIIPSDEQGIESIHSAVKAQKYLYDGVLYIERNGSTYNAQGAIVKQ